MSELQLSSRVSIDNLVTWNIGFISSETGRDITIPAGVKNYKNLTLGEIEGQIRLNNTFFCGSDGLGNNAYIKINDKKVYNYCFGLDDESNDYEETKLLTLESVKKLLKVKGKDKFEEELKKLVVTDAEKKMVVKLAVEAGIDEVEGYKHTLIEKLSGYKVVR